MHSFENVPERAMIHNFNHQGFDAIISAYRLSGGMTTADDLELMLEEKRKGHFVSVAQQIVSRDIFSFEWQSQFWVPMFQFHPQDMTVRQEVIRVVHELTAVLDNWTLAVWFTEPNSWLRGRRPVDMIDNRFSDVLHAARADRLVAAG